MSEDLIHKLARFTPSATGIHRDDWLFRAGRASAPSPRWWKRAVGVLALTQAVTLAAWATRPSTVDRATAPPPVGSVPFEPEQPPPLPSGSPDPNSYLVLSRSYSDQSMRPAPVRGDPAPADRRPTLTAGWRGELID